MQLQGLTSGNIVSGHSEADHEMMTSLSQILAVCLAIVGHVTLAKPSNRYLPWCRNLVWAPTQRGTAIVGYAFAVVGGPVLGPIVGGAVTQSYLRWRCKSAFLEHAFITFVFSSCPDLIKSHTITHHTIAALSYIKPQNFHLLVSLPISAKCLAFGKQATSPGWARIRLQWYRYHSYGPDPCPRLGTEYLTGIMMMTFLILDVLILDESHPSRLLVFKARRLRFQTGNWALHAAFEEWDVSLKEMAIKFGVRPFQMLLTPICFLVALYVS